MATINRNYKRLAAGYLFPEIGRRTDEWEKKTGLKAMKLGIGNTTEPMSEIITDTLAAASYALAEGNGFKLKNPELETEDILLRDAKLDNYTGYGAEQGNEFLREQLVKFYLNIGVKLDSTEFFVSDGAKCDSGNIQSIFGLENIVAVQDPAYPVYVDTNVIAGRAGLFDNETGQYDGLVYMLCNEENGFMPSVPKDYTSEVIDEMGISERKGVDMIYLCSPNNPTSAVMTKDKIQEFVDYARENKAVIIFDSAYAAFIKDDNLPRSIYEIPGAKECAIEISSFSKYAGFTGVRAGWSIVPKDLVVEGTVPGEVHGLWNRRQCTFFNGASNIVQAGAIAALSNEGQKACMKQVNFYMDNAKIIREGLNEVGLKTFGGDNAPYIWMQTPNKMDSWNFFDKLLEETRVVGTPGSGFGPSGQGYFRLSAFGHRENVEQAVQSIKDNLRL